MYMMNMLSFMSGLSMLEAEGVPAEVFLENMAIRMADMPGQFADALPKVRHNARAQRNDMPLLTDGAIRPLTRCRPSPHHHADE